MPIALILIIVGLLLWLLLHGIVATIGLILLIIGVVVLVYDLVVSHRGSRAAP